MNRRDFLRLRAQGSERVLELSCERLYVRWVDAGSGTGGATRAPEPAEWSGEPPTDVVTETQADVLAELDRRLAEADALRLSGPEWLADAELRRAVDARVEAFGRRGGRVA